MSYPTDLLSSRAIIKPGEYAVIPKDGLVNNVIPGFENCNLSILVSPKIGASFVHYLVEVNEGGKNISGFPKEDNNPNEIETFFYCISGEMKVWNEDKKVTLKDGGFFYSPPGKCIYFENLCENSKVILYKQKHEELKGNKPYTVIGNKNDLSEVDYEGMSNMRIIDFLPKDLCFDMNMHILTFDPGACHPFVETHVQEHGAYILSGEGIYYLGDKWIPVKKGDYIWFGPFAPQAVYAVGREKLSYIYSKDCNRDVKL